MNVQRLQQIEQRVSIMEASIDKIDKLADSINEMNVNQKVLNERLGNLIDVAVRQDVLIDELKKDNAVLKEQIGIINTKLSPTWMLGKMVGIAASMPFVIEFFKGVA